MAGEQVVRIILKCFLMGIYFSFLAVPHNGLASCHFIVLKRHDKIIHPIANSKEVLHTFTSLVL